LLPQSRSFQRREPTDPFLESPVQFHLAVGKEITYLKPYSTRYTGGGDEALINGLRGTVNHRDGYWQGYLGGDMEVIIDLGKEQPIRSVGTTFLHNKTSWIFLPDSVTFYLSSDGKHFHSINEIPNVIDKKSDKPIIQPFNQTFPDTPARYIKVRAKSPGKCPSWHEGAGQDCWIFVDEIVVM
jgi:hexosaminidase